MDKYVIAPPSGSTNNSVGAADRPWREGHFDTLPNWQEYLAESTGYGIVSGCAPSISGLTVTVGAGIVHLANGTRKEIASTNITLDAADSTNPRIDLVYITSAGEVAKVTGTAGTAAIAGSREYTIVTNFTVGDTVKFGGETFTATSSTQNSNNFVVGNSTSASASNLAIALNANKVKKYFAFTANNDIITATEKNAGNKYTPGDMTVTGNGEVLVGTATMSTPAIIESPELPDNSMKICYVYIEHMSAVGVLKNARSNIRRLQGINIYRFSDYGAVGDGVTDDTQAVQEAINNGDNCVILGEGKKYKVSDEIVIDSKKNLTIVDATIFLSAINDKERSCFGIKNSEKIRIANCGLIRDTSIIDIREIGWSNSKGRGIGSGVFITYSKSVIVEQCEIEYHDNGVTIKRSLNVDINDNEIHEIGGEFLSGHGLQIRIRNNNCYHHCGDGFLIKSEGANWMDESLPADMIARGMIVEGNYLHDPCTDKRYNSAAPASYPRGGGIGTNAESALNVLNDSIIIKNNIMDGLLYGICLYAFGEVTVANNEISNCVSHCIDVLKYGDYDKVDGNMMPCKPCSIINNTIHDNACIYALKVRVNASGYTDITKLCVVEGNRFKDNRCTSQEGSIMLYDCSFSNNVMSGCDMSNNNVPPFVYAENAVISDNIFVDIGRQSIKAFNSVISNNMIKRKTLLLSRAESLEPIRADTCVVNGNYVDAYSARCVISNSVFTNNIIDNCNLTNNSVLTCSKNCTISGNIFSKSDSTNHNILNHVIRLESTFSGTVIGNNLNINDVSATPMLILSGAKGCSLGNMITSTKSINNGSTSFTIGAIP